MAQRIGVYPGTFDPITLGHMDIIVRGAKLVDELIIGVTTNASKSPMFADDERIAIVEREARAMGIDTVFYTPLTPPTNREVYKSRVGVGV